MDPAGQEGQPSETESFTGVLGGQAVALAVEPVAPEAAPAKFVPCQECSGAAPGDVTCCTSCDTRAEHSLAA